MMLALKIAGVVAGAVVALWLLSAAWFLFCMWVHGKVWRQ